MLGLLVRRRLREIGNALRARGVLALLAYAALAAGALAGLGALAFEAFRATVALATEGGFGAFDRGDPALAGPLWAAPRVFLQWREYVYWTMVLCAAATAYAGQHLFYWRADWPLLGALPIPPAATHAAAALDLWAATVALPVAGAALAAPLYWAREWGAVWAALGTLFVGHGVAVVAATFVLPLAGASAIGGASSFKQYLGGNWAPAEFAPFFYAPAGVLALTAFGGIPVQKAVEDLAWAGAPGRGLAVLGAAALAAAAAFAAGRRWHVRAHARAVPLVREVALRMIATEDQERVPPYGDWLARFLPAHLRPLLARDLRQMNRAARGRWAAAFAAAAAFALYALRVEALPAWAALACAGFTVWLGGVSIRLGDGDLDVPWIARALPVGRSASVAPRALLGTFLALHFALPTALVFYLHDRGTEALALCALPGVAATVAATVRHAAAQGTLARTLHYLAAAAAALGAVWRPLAGAALYLGAAAIASLVAGLVSLPARRTA